MVPAATGANPPSSCRAAEYTVPYCTCSTPAHLSTCRCSWLGASKWVSSATRCSMAAITSSCPVLMKVPELQAGASRGGKRRQRQRECQQVRKREQSLGEGQSCKQGAELCLRHMFTFHILVWPQRGLGDRPTAQAGRGREEAAARDAPHNPHHKKTT